MKEDSKPHLSSLGAYPRVDPRPEYPPLMTVLNVQAKTLLWVTGMIGTLLTLSLWPAYSWCVEKMRMYSEAVIFTVLLNGSHTILWSLVNGPLLYFDAHSLMQEYKLHRTEGQKPSKAMIRENVLTAVVMQVLVNPVLGYYLHAHWSHLGLLSMHAPLPTVQDIFTSLLIAHTFNDVFFYITHRAFHSKALYFLHKQHHTFAGTIGPAAEYANPVEVVIANIFPTFYGCLFFGCKHPLVLFAWVAIRLQETYFAHSGYCFKDTTLDFLGLVHTTEAIHHDHHHISNKGNFGCMFMDYIFGTMDHFVHAGGQESYLQRGKKSVSRIPAAAAAKATPAVTAKAKATPSPRATKRTRSRSRGRK
eukprot:GSChrysophyteH1.ASY1.ANO1.2805.1 assembled CDS